MVFVVNGSQGKMQKMPAKRVILREEQNELCSYVWNPIDVPDLDGYQATQKLCREMNLANKDKRYRYSVYERKRNER